MTRTILFTTRSADVNPMYAKFRDKFSYQGGTIGDYMRQQARKDGFSEQPAKKQSAVFRDTTAENRITKANSLPREKNMAPASDYTAVLPSVNAKITEKKRAQMPIGTMLIMFLCATILMLLIYIGMNVNNMTHEIAVMKAEAAELQSVEQTLSSRLDTKNDLELIESIATDRLGMVRRNSVEHNYIAFGDTDTVSAYNAENEDNPLIAGLLSAFTAGFSK